jgi:16S rRNA (guanine527-N7)-methyltransferase
LTQRSIDVTPRTEDAIAIRDAIYKLEDQLPVEVTDEVIEKAAWWGATVLAGNDTLNLTRITDPDEMALKHFIDSWSVMGVLRDVPAGATLLDIGTGAGFPGVPIALARPDITTIFIDTMANASTGLRPPTQPLNGMYLRPSMRVRKLSGAMRSGVSRRMLSLRGL